MYLRCWIYFLSPRRTSVRTIIKASIVILSVLSASASSANEWVVGNVALIEDYRAYDSYRGILITLSNKSYPNGPGTIASTCTQRYRVNLGTEGVTAEVQKTIFAMLLAARATGDKVRLYVNPQNVYANGYCAVQIASMGDDL